MIPADEEELETRLQEAIHVYSLLPGIQWPRGFHVNWPEFLASWQDYLKETPEFTADGAPAPHEIDQAHDIMIWLSHLKIPDQRRLVLLRATGVSFNVITGYKFNFRGTGVKKNYTSQYLNQRHRDFLVMILASIRKKRVSKVSKI